MRTMRTCAPAVSTPIPRWCAWPAAYRRCSLSATPTATPSTSCRNPEQRRDSRGAGTPLPSVLTHRQGVSHGGTAVLASAHEQRTRHRPGGATQWTGVHGVHAGGGMVVPPAPLRHLRARRVLRLLPVPARDPALPRERSRDDPELRTRRGLVLELPHRS